MQCGEAGREQPHALDAYQSTPNMTGRRFHRTMEMIPARPWQSKSPSVSTPIKQSTKQGNARVRARYGAELPPFISTVRCPGRPVILGMEPRSLGDNFWEKRMGGFRKGGISNNRFVLKPDVAIASEVSILSKNSLAITDFNAKKTQHVQLFETPLPGTPRFAIPNCFCFHGAFLVVKFLGLLECFVLIFQGFLRVRKVEGVRVPQNFWKLPWTSPNLPRRFPASSPACSWKVLSPHCSRSNSKDRR